MPSYFDDPLIPIDQQAPTAMFTVDTNGDEVPVFDDEAGYEDFGVDSNHERFYRHPNLPYCSSHTVGVKDNATVIIKFYAGDLVLREESLQGDRETYIQAGVTKIGFKTTSSTATVRSWSQDAPIASSEGEEPSSARIVFTNTIEGDNNPNGFLHCFNEDGLEIFNLQYGYSLEQAIGRDVPIFQEAKAGIGLCDTYDSDVNTSVEDEGFVAALDVPLNATPAVTDTPIQIREAENSALAVDNINWVAISDGLTGAEPTTLTNGIAVRVLTPLSNTNETAHTIEFFDPNADTIQLLTIVTGFCTHNNAVTLPNALINQDYTIIANVTKAAQTSAPITCDITSKTETMFKINSYNAETGTSVGGDKAIQYTIISAPFELTSPQIDITKDNETTGLTETTIDFKSNSRALLCSFKIGSVSEANATSGATTVSFNNDTKKLNYNVLTTVRSGAQANNTVSNPYDRAVGGFKAYAQASGVAVVAGFDWLVVVDDVAQEDAGILFRGDGSEVANHFLRMDVIGEGSDIELATLQYGFNDATTLTQRSVPLEPIPSLTSTNTGYVTANTFSTTAGLPDTVITVDPALETVASNKNAPVAVLDGSADGYTAENITYLGSEILNQNTKTVSPTGLGIQIVSTPITDTTLKVYANDVAYLRIFDQATQQTLIIVQQFIGDLTGAIAGAIDFEQDMPDNKYIVTANAIISSDIAVVVRVTAKNTGFVAMETDATNAGTLEEGIVTGHVIWVIDDTYQSEYLQILEKNSATDGPNQTVKFYGPDQSGLMSVLQLGSFPNIASPANTIIFNTLMPTIDYTLQNVLLGATSTTSERRETVNAKNRTKLNFLAYNLLDGNVVGTTRSGCDWLAMWARDNTVPENAFFWTTEQPAAAGSNNPTKFLNFFDDDGVGVLAFRVQYGYSLSCNKSTRSLPYVQSVDAKPGVICDTYTTANDASPNVARAMIGGGGTAGAPLGSISASIYQTAAPSEISQDTFCFLANSNNLTDDFTSPALNKGTGIQTIHNDDNTHDRQTIVRYYTQIDEGASSASTKLVVMSGRCTSGQHLTFENSFTLPNSNFTILLMGDELVLTPDAYYAPSYQNRSATGFTPLLFNHAETKNTTSLGMNYMVIWATDTDFNSDSLRITQTNANQRPNYIVEFHSEADANGVNELLCTWMFGNQLGGSGNGKKVSLGTTLKNTEYLTFATPNNAGQSTQTNAVSNPTQRKTDSFVVYNVNPAHSPTGYNIDYLLMADEEAQNVPPEVLSFTNAPGNQSSDQYFQANSGATFPLWTVQSGGSDQDEDALKTSVAFDREGGASYLVNLGEFGPIVPNTSDPTVLNNDGEEGTSSGIFTMRLSERKSGSNMKIPDIDFLFAVHKISPTTTTTVDGDISLDTFFSRSGDEVFGYMRYYETNGGADIFVVQHMVVDVSTGTHFIPLPRQLEDNNYIVAAQCTTNFSSSAEVVYNASIPVGTNAVNSLDVRIRDIVTGDSITDQQATVTLYWARASDFTSDIINVKKGSGAKRAVEFFAPDQDGRIALLNWGILTTDGNSATNSYEIANPTTDYVTTITAESEITRASVALTLFSETVIGIKGYDGQGVKDDVLAHWVSIFIRD